MNIVITHAQCAHITKHVLNVHILQSMCARMHAATACVWLQAASCEPAQFGNQRISSCFRNVTHYAVRDFVSYCRSDTVVIDRNLQQRACVAQEKIVGVDTFDLGVQEIVDVLQACALR